MREAETTHDPADPRATKSIISTDSSGSHSWSRRRRSPQHPHSRLNPTVLPLPPPHHDCRRAEGGDGGSCRGSRQNATRSRSHAGQTRVPMQPTRAADTIPLFHAETQSESPPPVHPDLRFNLAAETRAVQLATADCRGASRASPPTRVQGEVHTRSLIRDSVGEWRNEDTVGGAWRNCRGRSARLASGLGGRPGRV